MDKTKMYDVVYDIKNGLVNEIVKALGERKLDVSGDNVRVFAIEHHCNEGLWGTLNTISAEGFEMGDGLEGDVLRWHDMIVEDLAMVLDYLRTGNW